MDIRDLDMKKRLKPEGCIDSIGCSSKAEAEALLKTAERIYAKR